MTDLPYRVLCKEQGACLLCIEMVSAKAILYNNKNTESLLEIHPDEQPVSLQFFGSDPKIMSEMAKRVEERPFDIMDINMGCPVTKVVRNGEGSALMKNPKLVHEIVSAVSKAIEKPVTVKIRKGFDDDHINAVEIAKIIEDAGGAAVAAVDYIKEHGGQKIKFMSIIAAPKGVETLMKAHPDIQLYVGALDRELDDNAYIRPGLGDAGDRIFGTK